MNKHCLMTAVLMLGLSVLICTEANAQNHLANAYRPYPHRGPVRKAGKWLGLGWGAGNHWRTPGVDGSYYNPYSEHNSFLLHKSPEYLAQYGDLDSQYPGAGMWQNGFGGNDFGDPYNDQQRYRSGEFNRGGGAFEPPADNRRQNSTDPDSGDRERFDEGSDTNPYNNPYRGEGSGTRGFAPLDEENTGPENEIEGVIEGEIGSLPPASPSQESELTSNWWENGG